MDAAVCAAGYNTFEELLAANIPSAFFPQVKGLDRQDLRIIEGRDNGWNEYIDNIDNVTLIRQVVNKLLDESELYMSRLSKRDRAFGSLNAAVEILRISGTPHTNMFKNIYVVAEFYKMWAVKYTEFSPHNFKKLVHLAVSILPYYLGKYNWLIFQEDCTAAFNSKYQAMSDTLFEYFEICVTIANIEEQTPEILGVSVRSVIQRYYKKNEGGKVSLKVLEQFQLDQK